MIHHDKKDGLIAEIPAQFTDATGVEKAPGTSIKISIYDWNDEVAVVDAADMAQVNSLVGFYHYAWDITSVPVGSYYAQIVVVDTAANYSTVLSITLSDTTTVASNVSDILTDTGTTIPGTITTMQGNVTSILEDTGTTIPATIDALPTAAENTTELLDHDVTAHNTADTVGEALNNIATAGLGSGGTDIEFTITDTDGTVEQGVQVVVYSDVAMTTANAVTGTLITDSAGKVTCYLDAGTYYAKASKEGKTFSNPTTVTVP